MAGKGKKCKDFVRITLANNGSGKVLGLMLAFILSNLAHHLLKPVYQPRIASDIIIGLVLGSIKKIRDSFEAEVIMTIDFIVEFGMIFYMFVLGLEMDFYVILKRPTRGAIVAYSGMISTFILSCSITPFLHYAKTPSIDFTLCLAFIAAGSGSHILSRVITSLKIGKSDIGKLGMAAGVHADMVSMLMICLASIFFPRLATFEDSIKAYVTKGAALIIQSVFAAKVSPVFMNWINNENPEGKAMKGTHLVLSLAFMVFVCSCSPWYGYSSILSAFMAGIFFPSEGRISKWTVGKINYLLSTVYYPIFFFWVGYHARLDRFEAANLGTWARFFMLIAINIVGKVTGTVICGFLLGFRLPESVALGLLLTAKGHFAIFLAVLSFAVTTTNAIIVICIFLSVVHTPFVVRHIIERARKRAPTRRMALQGLDPSQQLRILLCLHGPHNLASTINFIEISRGPANPGIMVYVTDLIELTDQIAATLVHQEGALESVDTVTVTDKAVMEMREEITRGVQSYVDENGEGITLKRMLALSSFGGMPQDICVIGEDLMVSLIVLPFHKRQQPDGTLDAGHPGFRYVNRKLLRNSSCSIGILVDRGLGQMGKKSPTQTPMNVAVIFIGGRDDREALAYAGRVARHRGVRLTVIRFLLDNSENSQRSFHRDNTAEYEEEMKLDDEAFAEFYERHVAGGHVAYKEKHMANSAETYETLRSLEGQYALIIVGRGGRVNSTLTAGMNDWQQCPELGPVGDVLSGSDFSVSTSVLIIKQHDTKGGLDGLDEDFSIM
ncbi:cation/H(+) antiporter 28-like [Mangifera indica]|uniref:cation/H(+) antiporter 28-like n=1 Tax=Mangifera indica TaxID=29780 RepID=UPI001CF9F9B5|nr:cation/H(+) antiporter 28-like [Mangifera indica]